MRKIIIDQRPHHNVPVIPHILKTNRDGSIDMVTDGPMFCADQFEIIPIGTKRMITEVIESRPARGDWSGESYKGMTPTFSRIYSR